VLASNDGVHCQQTRDCGWNVANQAHSEPLRTRRSIEFNFHALSRGAQPCYANVLLTQDIAYDSSLPANLFCGFNRGGGSNLMTIRKVCLYQQMPGRYLFEVARPHCAFARRSKHKTWQLLLAHCDTRPCRHLCRAQIEETCRQGLSRKDCRRGCQCPSKRLRNQAEAQQDGGRRQLLSAVICSIVDGCHWLD
jgi:hypothetical protein